MNKETLKTLAKIIVPVLLTIGVTYGYVDSNCTCDAPAPALESD